jgi:hypothetical protein
MLHLPVNLLPVAVLFFIFFSAATVLGKPGDQQSASPLIGLASEG